MFCLMGLVALLRKMLLGASTRIIYKATNINGYVGMVIGCGVTILVQSSSITTSTLIPLAGIGLLKLEQIYPLTLGADIGTTFTALMAAMVSNPSIPGIITSRMMTRGFSDTTVRSAVSPS